MESRRLQVLASHLISGTRNVTSNNVCGIIGVVSHEPVAQYLMEGLKIMV
jgi:hypothetical protein